jgi:tetratricopeptide (TPR) repeat protein
MKFKVVISFLLFVVIVTAQPDTNNQKFSLAQSYEQAGDFQSAAKLYEELYQSDQSNSLYVNSLYRVYTQLKNYAAAVDILEKQIKRVPDDISSYGMLGSTYFLMGNEEKANEVWDKPFQSPNPNPIFFRVIAEYAVSRRAFEKAIDLYERGKNVSEDKTLFSFDLARLYSLTMQFEKAAEEYFSILILQPQQLSSVESKILENINKPGALDAAIKVAEAYDDGNISIQYLLARLYSEKGLFDKAYEKYIEIDRAQSNQGNDLYRFADFLLREKNYSLSAKVFQKIIDLYPDSPLASQAKLGYAKSLEADLFNKYVEVLPLWKTYFPLITYTSDEIEKILSAFDEVINLYQHTEPAYEGMLRKGVIKFYLQGDSVESKQIFSLIVKEAPLSKASPNAYFELGNISLLGGNINDAEKYISDLLNLRNVPGDQKKLAEYKLARIKFYQGEYEESRKLLSNVLDDLKDNSANDALELSLLLNTSKNDSSNLSLFAEAEFLADQKKFKEAGEKYKILSENPKAFVLHSIALLRYGEMMLAVDDYQQAITVFESISSEGAKNIYADKAVYLLGKIYQFGTKDLIKAEEYYQKLLADFPNSIYKDDAREQIILLKNKPS